MYTLYLEVLITSNTGYFTGCSYTCSYSNIIVLAFHFENNLWILLTLIMEERKNMNLHNDCTERKWVLITKTCA